MLAGQRAGRDARGVHLGRRLQDRLQALVERHDLEQPQTGVAERLHRGEEQAEGRREGDEVAGRQRSARRVVSAAALPFMHHQEEHRRRDDRKDRW